MIRTFQLKIIRVGDNITLDFNTSEPISGYGSGYNTEGQPILESCTNQEGIPGGYGHCEHDVVLSLLPIVFFTGPDGFRREASVSGSNDSWKAFYPVDPLKDDNLSLDLDYEITITDTSGNEKQYLSVADLDESAQPKSDGNLMTVKLDTVAPRVETLTLASTNSSTNPDLGSNTLLAKKDDKVTLTFTTSERVINPEVQINNFLAETSYLNFDGDDDNDDDDDDDEDE